MGTFHADKEVDFCSAPLKVLPEHSQTSAVELDELLAFFSNPAKAFFTQRWQTRLTRIYEAQSDDEPFELDALARYILNERFVVTQQEDWTTRLRAEGKLPTGNIADISLQPVYKQSQALLDAIVEVIGGPLDEVPAQRVEINFTLNDLLAMSTDGTKVKIDDEVHASAWLNI